MILRALTVLAILAALTGAPSSVLGAGNELSDAQAIPTTGSTETTFTVAVRYDGRFAALETTALVAGRVVDLQLTSGSPQSGTWSGTVSGLLPGSWPVVFTALPELGNAPTLTGLTLTVTAAATPLPTLGSLDPSAPDSRHPDGGSDDGNAPDPEPAQDTLSPASPAGAGSSPSTDPTADAAPTAPAEADPAAGHEPTGPALATPSGASTGPGPDASTPGRGGDVAASRSDAEPVSGPGGRSSAGARAADDDDESHRAPAASAAADDMVSTVLFVGLSGVAAVAIIGAALLAAGRRRRPQAEPGPVRAESTQRDEVDQLLMRRTLRRKRTRLAEDPIVAALGIDGSSDERRRARRRAGQVDRGPGERPRPERSGP